MGPPHYTHFHPQHPPAPSASACPCTATRGASAQPYASRGSPISAATWRGVSLVGRTASPAERYRADQLPGSKPVTSTKSSGAMDTPGALPERLTHMPAGGPGCADCSGAALEPARQLPPGDAALLPPTYDAAMAQLPATKPAQIAGHTRGLSTGIRALASAAKPQCCM
jgi:hypothetical protein